MLEILEKGRVRKKPRYKIKDMWEALQNAAQRHRKCRIRYRKRNKRGGGESEYFVAPYSFRNKPGGEVLFAYDFVEGRIKSFFRSGVTGVHVTERRFQPKWDVELSLGDDIMNPVMKSFLNLAEMLIKEEPLPTMDEFFHQGLSAKKHVTREDVDPEQLRMGIEVELEHTDNRVVAEKIAVDHLAEDPLYYTHLLEMETKYQKKGQ
jgi:predicted DNA-binding transcriptional regulator YafY